MKQFLILFFIISNVFSQTLSNKATFFLSDSTRLDYLDEFDNFYIKKIIKDLRHELNKERKRDFEKPFRLVFHPEERTSRFTGKFKFFDNNVGRQLFQKELKYLKMLSAAQGNTFSKEGERAIAAKHGGLAETKTQKIPAWTERLNKKILPTDWAIWANLNTDYYPSWEDLKSHFGGIEEMIAAGITGKKDVMEFGVLIEIDSLEFTSKSQWKSNITFTIKNEIAREFYNVKFFNQKSDLGFKTFPIGGKYNYLKKRKHQSVNILSQLENPDYNSFLRLKHQKVNVNKSNLIIDNDVYNVNMLISLDKIKNRIFSFADNDSTPSNSRKVFFTFSNKPDIPIVFGFESFFNSFEEFGNGIFENFNDWEDDFVIAFQNLINSLDSKIDDEIFIDLLIKEFDLTRKLLFIESGCFFLPYDKYYNTVDKYYDKLEYQILKLEFQEILNE